MNFPFIGGGKIQAKAMAWFRVFAAFAFPSLVRSMRMRAANADELILCYSARGCVADVVYFSSPHQRSGKSGNGDSGKRNEVRRPIPYWKLTLVNVILILAFACQIILLFLELTEKAK
jgi:hypothetical protein